MRKVNAEELTKEQITQIRWLYEMGWSINAIARYFSWERRLYMTPSQVKSIALGCRKKNADDLFKIMEVVNG